MEFLDISVLNEAQWEGIPLPRTDFFQNPYGSRPDACKIRYDCLTYSSRKWNYCALTKGIIENA
jgi:hypothetical protein